VKAASEANSGIPLSARPCILLVDDDPIILETFGESLRGAGFEVIEARDGARALQICIAQTPALAVIDYAMPGLSGVELARQLVAQTDVPFLFLSAHSEERIVQQAVAAGALTFLLKPTEPAALIPAVRAALERSREVLALRSETERLNAALRINRNVGVATGLVMARFKITQVEAFERLRTHARSRRVRLEEVVDELLHATEQTSKLYDSLDPDG
jgi:two-component system, response regulator PdtaR